MDANLISMISLAVAIVAVVYAFVVGRQKVTVKNVSAAVDVVPRIASEIAAVATTVVQGIEQVKREGNISNEQAYSLALDQMRDWIKVIVPTDIKISNEQIISAVKSAILVASALTHQIEAAKEIAEEPPKPNALPAITPYPLPNPRLG